jgi:hypothetical protein
MFSLHLGHYPGIFLDIVKDLDVNCFHFISLWRLNLWFEDFICALVQWYLEYDSFSCQETDTENFAK